MAEYKKKDFTGQNVAMDGNSYEDCNFTNAKMTYSGGNAPSIIGCNFTGSLLTFNGAAANTVVLLQALANDPVLIGVVHGFLPQFKPKS
jgi:hypothetical protein